jgi:hypothetical protein
MEKEAFRDFQIFFDINYFMKKEDGGLIWM